jgi:hypothetical protein
MKSKLIRTAENCRASAPLAIPSAADHKRMMTPAEAIAASTD